MKKRSFLIVIPARFSSKRFPGKPLALINNKPMINYVWDICKDVVNSNNIIVATEDIKINKHCIKNKMNVIMTSKKCLTGTDRVYEVSKKLKRDIYINVQGDEPLINRKDLESFIKFSLKNYKLTINAYSEIKNTDEYSSLNVPKLVYDKNDYLLYMSRSKIPGNKKDEFIKAYKQVCMYSFPKKDLTLIGKMKKKSLFEKIEDIEILRFIEMGIKVKMFRVKKPSIAVDIDSDIKKVEALLSNK